MTLSSTALPHESESVIAIVEWEEADENHDDSTVMRRAKVRFHGMHQDESSPSAVAGTIHQQCVQRVLVQQRHNENDQQCDDSDHLTRDSAIQDYQTLIYNPPTREYLPIESIEHIILSSKKMDPSDPNIQNVWKQWTNYLGSRWRIQLVRHQNDSFSPAAQQENVLAIQGRAFGAQSDDAAAACFHIPHTDMTLRFQESWNQPNSTAFTVWDASLALAHWLAENPQSVANKCVVELGAGCGLTGLTAASLGASHVYLTDLPNALPLTQVELNRHVFSSANERSGTIVECHGLDWYAVQEEASRSDRARANPLTTLDFVNPQTSVILVADCVWTLPLVEPLLATMVALQRHCTKPPIVMIAYQQRGRQTHDAFWNGLHDIFDTVQVLKIPTQAQNGNALYLWECKGAKKKES